jgi:hypothetical protein
MEVHCARVDKEIRTEPVLVYGTANGFVPWYISLLYAVSIYDVAWQTMGFHVVKENACQCD